MSWLHRAGPQVLAAWRSTKVELQGWLSASRLRKLDAYTEVTSVWRVLWVCLLSPLPCLALILALDAVPLVPPEAGVAANYVFWMRGWAVTFYVDCNAILMICDDLPQLNLSLWHPIVIATVGATCSMVVVIALVSTTVFPFPFGFLVASPPSCMVIFAGFAYFWGHRCRTDEELRRSLAGQLSAFACQITLTFVYPMFISAFQKLDGYGQMLFVLLLPIIKIANKNWISHALDDRHDPKPKAVTLSVEVFHALYVSIAMQSSASVWTTLVLMILDLLQCFGSMRNIMITLREVRQLLRKIPRGHPFANKSILQVAVQLQMINEQRGCHSLSRSGTEKKKSARKPSISPDPASVPNQSQEHRDNMNGRSDQTVNTGCKPDISSYDSIAGGVKFSTRKVTPTNHPGPIPSDIPKGSKSTPEVQVIRSPEVPADGIADSAPVQLGLESIFTRHERATFVRQTARALFTAEYFVLVEYTEVAIPFIYSTNCVELYLHDTGRLLCCFWLGIDLLLTPRIFVVVLCLQLWLSAACCLRMFVPFSRSSREGIYLVCIFQMPNCTYYTSLASLDSAQRVATVTNVLTYASLELASLVTTTLILKGVIGISIIRQLAFVLDSEKMNMQSRLSTWVVYVLQIPLVHMGERAFVSTKSLAASDSADRDL